MQNKPASHKPASKSWHEIEVLLSAIAIALTLGLWNVFASSSKSAAASTDSATNPPPPPDTPTVISVAPTPSFSLLPGQVLLLGGVLPTMAAGLPTPGITTSTNPNPAGGGGGGTKPPKTHSSHP